MDPELLASLKTFIDRTRLRILGQLAARPCTADELATALAMSRRTVDRQLRLLAHVGLVATLERAGERTFELRVGRLAELAAGLARLDEPGTPSGLELVSSNAGQVSPEEAKVLRAFVVGGRLASIPAQVRKRAAVLRYLARTVFESDRDYPEKDVNMLLALRHPDVASLRRYLVDSGFMRREAGVYRLRPQREWPPPEA